jgi:hypothetical protein
MRVADGYHSDQHAIWDSIHRKAANFEVRSTTGAASDIFEDRRALLDRMVGEIPALSGQIGAAFLVRGELSGIELFGSADTFSRLLPKLVRSYGLDALDERSLGRRPRATEAGIAKFLATLQNLPTFRKPALGLGEDLRFEGIGAVGAALIHEGEIVHLSVFTRIR